jgi:PEP-CTERM motif
VEGSDILDLTLTRRLDGNLVIQFRDIDDPANTNTLIDQSLLDTGHSQICLRLERPDPSDNSIFASFSFINGGGVCGSFTTFVNTADIFDGENFTRAEFRASGPVPVPEPGSLWLIGFGLILLFAARYL